MKFTKIGAKPTGTSNSGTSTPGGNSTNNKAVFQVDPHMRVRFNADGWVEELGRGIEGSPPGTALGGLSSSKLDDLHARRFYDLYSRVIIFEIHPRRDTDQTRASGVIPFRDLEPDSPMHTRVNKIIEYGNQNFGMNIKPLA